MRILIVLSLALRILFVQAKRVFPDDFQFGVATSAYQIEGAWNESGKGENIWDRFTHTRQDMIADHSNGDITSDSYHKLNEDLEDLKWMGVDYYRFSLSWSRLLPSGYSNKINPDGVRYYNQLIDGLLARNITPMVTIYHWDLPQPLQEIGGWPNELLTKYFVDYARVVFKLFGDRVKLWITMNEPFQICQRGYGAHGNDMMAPGYTLDGVAPYLCGRTVLLSHARAYRMYNQEFKATQNGKVGFSADSFWFEPATNSLADQEAAERAIQCHYGWWAHPIFSKTGDYPPIMKERIAAVSKEENFPQSRLIPFTKSEVKLIQGTYDFLGLNYYTSQLASANITNVNWTTPSYEKDIGLSHYQDPSWPKTGAHWIRDVPWGIRKVLNWIKKQYDNPLIYITENGSVDVNEHHDSLRIKYLQGHMQAILDAINIDGCNVKAYTVWSIIDNFEWLAGFKYRFGLIYVDVTSPNKTRIKKDSAFYYKCVIKNRSPLCS